MSFLKRCCTLSSQKKKQRRKLRNTAQKKSQHHLHIPNDPNMTILQVGVVVILDLHHGVVHHEEVHCFHNHHHEELLHTRHEEVQVGVVPPIISLMAVLLHIRVKVPRHIEEVDLVATATALDTEIIHHRCRHHHHKVEILVIMIIHLCVRLLVGMGHLILEVAWILGQVIMTDTDSLLHSIAMTGGLHPHLAHPMDILHPMEEVEVVGDIMEVVAVTEVMVVTEVVLPLPHLHLITPSGDTEHLKQNFANFVV